jgi:PKD repeat protein
MNIKFGPYDKTQALYYSGIPGVIRRVVYVGDGNRSPEAVILADPTEGPVGVQVQFSGAGSSDLDVDGLKFGWDLDGDGVIDSTDAETSYTYTSAGVYNAALTVSDGKGGETTVKVEISVGNKPVPDITSPAAGSTFAVGDILTLVGSATDKENGQLADTSLTWEVRQHHDTHYHPFLDAKVGNNIVLQPAPEPEDYQAAGSSYLEIILTATDADGLSSNVTVEVQPSLVDVAFDTVPSGLDLFLDGSRLSTPATATTWESHNLHVEAPDQFIDGQAYVFSSWSNGGGQSQTIAIAAASSTVPKFVATFTQFTGTFPPTQAPFEEVKCLPCSLGLLAKLPETNLETGQAFVNEECNVFIVMQDDGNLVVTHGTPDNPGEEIWDSNGFEGAEGNIGDYYTMLQGDGNLVTRKGSTVAPGDTIWNTGGGGVEGDYFLGTDCNLEIVSVYEGR